MKIKLKLITTGILFSLSLLVQAYPDTTSQDQPWSITASVGRGNYPNLYPKGKDVALARLALSNEMILTGDFVLGLELGLQSGSHLHLQVPYENMGVLKWLPVQTALAPVLDLLITAKSDPLPGSALFAQVKGGIAYRRWQIKESQFDNLSQLATEIQAGFGYPITALASLDLLYQGVIGSDPLFQWNFYDKSRNIANIPTLHALLLGFSVNL